MRKPYTRLSFLSVLAFTSIFITGCRTDNAETAPLQIPSNDTSSVAMAIEPGSWSGLPDTLEEYEGRIKRNQFLFDIVEKFGVSYSQIEAMVKNSGDVFDIRKMKAGAYYTIYTGIFDTTRAVGMLYMHSPSERYYLSFNDSLYIEKIPVPTYRVMKYSSGVIESSLWNSMMDEGLNPNLAVELSEIYAWTIDFFGLQKGDRFKIIYEENYVDSVSTGIYKIYGAWFSHVGEDLYAIPIIQDGVESYYDLEGNSLRKAFLKAPLRYSRISSRYSGSRMHPILRIRRPHYGVDYAAPVGTPVHSIGDGKVIMAEYQNGSGRIVKVRHNSVYTTAYMHLSKFGPGIKVGKYIKQGDLVGYVGTSGLSTGPHLDFRFYKNGSPVDPLKVKAPPVDPIHEDNRYKFSRISTLIKDLLDSIE